MAAEEEVVELDLFDEDTDEASVDEPEPIRRWVRITLLALTVPWLAVFFVALFLIDPYENGEVARAGTHRQLGLPECNFKSLASVPCPSCGMTTSFTLLMHADVWNSVQANFAGTLLAGFGLIFIPWAFASAFFGRFVFIRSLEIVIFRLALAFLVIMFGRWMVVVIWDLLSR